MNIETAKKLHDLRKKHHLSQEGLAEKLGVSRQAVSKWERAEASPDTDNLILLAKLYNVSIDELLNIDVKSFVENKDIPKVEPKEEKSSTVEEFSKQDTFNANNYTISPTENFQAIGTIPKVNIRYNPFDFLENLADIFESFLIKNNLTYKSAYRFPYYAIAVAMFFIWGYLIGFNLSWGWFLTIPMYYTTIKCLQDRNPYIFCYPVFSVIMFFIQSYLFGCNLSWLWFLTIPLYYTVIPAIKKNNPLIFCYPVVAVILFLFFGYLISYRFSLLFFATIPFYYWYFSKQS